MKRPELDSFRDLTAHAVHTRIILCLFKTPNLFLPISKLGAMFSIVAVGCQSILKLFKCFSAILCAITASNCKQ